jgi:hypothetical protein
MPAVFGPPAGPLATATGAIFEPATGFHAMPPGFTVAGGVMAAEFRFFSGMPATFGSGPTNGRAPVSGRGGAV